MDAGSRWRLLPRTRLGWLRAAVLLVIPVMAGLGALRFASSMPGRSYQGTAEAPAALAERLRGHVEALAGDIGPRFLRGPGTMENAAKAIQARLEESGYRVTSLPYQVEGLPVANVEAQVPGGSRRAEIVVVGAHYDTVPGCPGANDNGSGVAALLELARAFAGSHPERTLRFVAFANEEPPWFQTPAMGSLVYARACHQRGDRVVAMLSLETLGYYSDQEGSQAYPPPLGLAYPDRGDFLAFVADPASGHLLKRCIGTFRGRARLPSEGVRAPASIPGVGWSDHWSFWQCGYPAVMVTDTAPYRYPWYHSADDTPDRLDYARMALAVEGLAWVVADLAGGEPPQDLRASPGSGAP